MTEYERQKQAYLEKNIRKFYFSPIGRGEVKSFCILHNIKYEKLRRLARKLKCYQSKRILWTREEVKILEKNRESGGKTVHKLLKKAGFDRSIDAVFHKFSDEKSLPGAISNSYTVFELADIMGITSSTITKWINRRLLRAHKGGAGIYFLKIKDVREFIIDHVSIISIPNIDKYWLIDILANKKGNL